jgi:hypothetical protein
LGYAKTIGRKIGICVCLALHPEKLKDFLDLRIDPVYYQASRSILVERKVVTKKYRFRTTKMPLKNIRSQGFSHN